MFQHFPPKSFSPRNSKPRYAPYFVYLPDPIVRALPGDLHVVDADFVIRWVGARAGAMLNLPRDIERSTGYSPASNYFVRATGAPVEFVRATMEAIDFSEVRASSVKVPSVAKTELIALHDAVKCLRGPMPVQTEAPSLPSQPTLPLIW